MIVSMESKTGSRPRNRRRVGDNAAEAHGSVVTRGMTSAPIVVEDEDDDVVVSSPTAFAQAKSQSDRRLTRQSRVAEEDLELRLGLGGASHYSSRSASQSSATQQPSLLSRRGRQPRPTIDLTVPNRLSPPTRPPPVDEDCVFLNENIKSRKRKNAPVEPSFMKMLPPASPAQEEAEDHKLKCVICMDKMKDETSTTCGHIFCQSCIQGAIKAQKKCPTCRKKLTMKNIHRIYI